jgi:glycerophosphoryl diester phosphodiesterase
MDAMTESPLRPDGPIGFAHRGARSREQENTLPAFTQALHLGATGLESDAWITSDGAVVLDHDGVTGPLWRRQAVSAQARSRLPAHIPTLDDLYRVCGSDFELSLDVKDPAALVPLLQVADRAGAVSRLWLCYHDWRPIARWRTMTQDAHLVESTRLAWMPEGIAARAEALRAAGIDALNLHRSEWTTEVVDAVHGCGLAAFGWDAQTEPEISRLVGLGLDGIYSDHVDRMMTVIGSVPRNSG